jgi:hypothetical protein
VTQKPDPGIQALERHLKALVTVLRSLQSETHTVAKALTDIHGALVETNRGRDRWAREIQTVLASAKEPSE